MQFFVSIFSIQKLITFMLNILEAFMSLATVMRNFFFFCRMHERKVFETTAMSEFLQKIHEEKTSKAYSISLVQDQKVIFFMEKKDSIFVNLGIIYSFLLIFYIVYHLLNHGIFILLTNNLKSFLTIKMIECNI